MRVTARSDSPEASRADRPPASAPAVRSLALQRLAGNRAAARVLARWTKHPDPEQKGVMVPDVVATELSRLNPPTNA
jgi:hypothetical protein